MPNSGARKRTGGYNERIGTGGRTAVTRRSAMRCLSALGASAWLPEARSQDVPTVLQIGGATIDVTFSSDHFDLPRQVLLDWIGLGARAVSGYFGQFPVPHARLQIVMASGRRGGRVSGVTYGEGRLEDLCAE